jgi:hypothetical protein
MKQKTYRFAVHSPHFLCPVYIKQEVGHKESMAAVLDAIARAATVKWLNDFPEFFDNISAPDFYETLSIMVTQEV